MSNRQLNPPTANSCLDEWLYYIEHGHHQVIDLGLDRLAQVYQAMNSPRPANTLVTVAGTNGKGTTIALLNQLLLSQNKKVACYTSPHLVRFNERVVINDQQVSDDALCTAFAYVESCRGSITLTYFEYVTLAAFWLMAQQNPDVALLEIGMGGRLDAVNVLDPDIAIITSIDLDHCSWLGDTREKIAFEKAGIMRAGIPVISGDPNPPITIEERAHQLGAALYQRGKAFSAASTLDGAWCWEGTTVDREALSISSLPYPNIPFDNAVTAIQAFVLLMGECDQQIISQGLLNTFVEGRFQTLQKPFPCTLDVAHNPASGRCLAERLSRDYAFGRPRLSDEQVQTSRQRRFHALLAVLDDKDVSGLIKPMLHGFDHWLIAGLSVDRGLDAQHLALQLRSMGVDDYHESSNVKTAIQYYRDHIYQDERDMLVVFGSFYTVSEALNELSHQ